MGRREKLEALLTESPDDTFLRYALALEYASEGQTGAAAERLDVLLADDPQYVPAYLQLAQFRVQAGASESAVATLIRGIEIARRAGDQHAEDEMRGMLEQLQSP